MSEEKTINEDVSSIEVIKEEYEKKFSEMKADYEQKIKAMHEQHIAEIRTLMTSGTAPDGEEYQEELSEEERILDSLRNKYKLK